MTVSKLTSEALALLLVLVHMYLDFFSRASVSIGKSGVCICWILYMVM